MRSYYSGRLAAAFLRRPSCELRRGVRLARRGWLRLLGRLREAEAIKALPAALLGSFSRLGLARRCRLRLQGRLYEAEALKALLAERACGVCGCVCMRLCLAFLVSSRNGRESLAALALAGCSVDLPLLWARGLRRSLSSNNLAYSVCAVQIKAVSTLKISCHFPIFFKIIILIY